MQNFNVDISSPGGPLVFYAMQADSLSRFFTLTITDNGEAWDPPSGALWSVRFGAPQMPSGWYDTITEVGGGTHPAIDVSGNVATVEIAEQALESPGKNTLCVLVTNSSGYQIANWPILLQIQPVPGLTAPEATNYYNLLTAQVAQALQNAQNAAGSATAAANSAELSESWAIGGTGSRAGENTNNSKYWAQQSQKAANNRVASFNGRTGAVMPKEGDYTAADVGALSVDGGSVSGELQLDQGFYVFYPTRNLTTNGYVLILELSVVSIGIDMPIELFIFRRNTTGRTSLTVIFESSSTIDPDLLGFYFHGAGNSTDFYINKKSSGVWDLYVKKSNVYDEPIVSALFTNQIYCNEKINLVFGSTISSTVPESAVSATYKNIASALSQTVKIGNADFDGTESITLDQIGALQKNGTAAAATKLATSRKIGNASFDGTANITLAQIGAYPAANIRVGFAAGISGGQRSFKLFSQEQINDIFGTSGVTYGPKNLAFFVMNGNFSSSGLVAALTTAWSGGEIYVVNCDVNSNIPSGSHDIVFMAVKFS